MKKLLALILILALAVPAAAGADDRDPLIGCWYSVYDKELVPEMAANFDNCDMVIMIYYFADDGLVYSLVNNITSNKGTPLYGGMGKWENNNGEYTFSLIGFGNGTLTIEDDMIWLNLQNSYDVGLRKMEPFSPYTDYRYK